MRGRYSTANHHAFSELTPDSLYWIGFLMADGSVCRELYTTQVWKIALVLKAADYDHVAAFANFLSIAPPNRNVSAEVKGKRYPIVRKSVRSEQIGDDLARHGVVPAKSKIAKTSPECAASPEFWRGVFDGDGCLTVDKRNGALTLELAGAEDLMKQFCEFCRPLYPNTKTYPNGKLYVPRQINTKYVYRVRIGGPLSQHVLAALYDAPGPRLDRKEQQFRDWQASDWTSKRGRHQVES